MSDSFTTKLSNLADLSRGDVLALGLLMSRARPHDAQTDLILEGDKPAGLLVMLEGWACRYKILPDGKRQVLAFMLPGDACDLHAGLLTEMDHSIQTITAAEVVSIPGEAMQHLMDTHPTIAQAMYVAQLIDAATMRAWLVSIGRRSSIERVAHLVCELYLRMKSIGLASADRFVLPFSQIILADSLGVSTVHLNRVLKELRNSGGITLRRGRVEINDLGKLVHISGFDENYLHRREAGRAL